MLIRNVHLQDQTGLWQLLIEEGRFVRISSMAEDLGYEGARILLDGADERTVIAPTLVERRPHPTVRE